MAICKADTLCNQLNSSAQYIFNKGKEEKKSNIHSNQKYYKLPKQEGVPYISCQSNILLSFF